MRSQTSETRRVSQASVSASLRPALLVPRARCSRAPGSKSRDSSHPV